MKINCAIINLVFYFFVISFCYAQDHNSRKLICHDSIYFKKISKSYTKSTYQNRFSSALVDTSQIYYKITLTEDTLGIEVFYRNNNKIAATHYIYGTYNNYSFLTTSNIIYNERFFVCPGFSIYEPDTLTGGSTTRSILYVFEIPTHDSVRFHNYLNNFSSINGLYASGYSHFDSGGGFSGSSCVYGSYILTDNELTITGSYGVNDGAMIHFMDGKYNTVGHLFRSHYFGAGITTLSQTNINWEFLAEISWESEDIHPVLFDGTSPISINHKPNYLITTASTELANHSNNQFLIIDLEDLAIIDTFNATQSFEEIWCDGTGTFYFKNYNDSNIFIIDHFRHFTNELFLNNSLHNGDTLGYIIHYNIFGENLRFHSENNLFKIDSLIGIITLKSDITYFSESDTILNCYLQDGFFHDTVSIRINLPVSIIENKHGVNIYPNPARSKINIDNKTKVFCKIKLVDLNGRIVYQTSFTEHTSINTSRLKEGIYLLLIANNNKAYCQKVVIN